MDKKIDRRSFLKNFTFIALGSIFGGAALSSCSANDPLIEDLYTKSVIPSKDKTYNLGSALLNYKDVYANSIYINGEQLVKSELELIHDVTNGDTCVSIRPTLDYGRVLGVAKPTLIYRGIVRGFSLPIYNNDNEVLFFCTPFVPARWDGISDPCVIIEGYLDTANNAKKFGLQCSWTKNTTGTDIVTDTTAEDPTVEITTENWAQYQSFRAIIPLNYDILGVGNELKPGDCLNLRIYRVAATIDEIAGEVVIIGVTIRWRINKFYGVV